VTPPPGKILLTRTDRIGDVVLTLPMVSVLKQQFPKAEVWILLRRYTAELGSFASELSGVLLADEQRGTKSFLNLLNEIRSHRFDAVVLAYPRPRLALMMRVARIATRVGTGYRWYSVLFNRKVYEHRKTAEKHEAEYNLGLLRGLGCEIPTLSHPHISVNASQREEAMRVRRNLGIHDSERMVILHPGSGGSARDWSVENFVALAASLVKSGFAVVVTGSAAEALLARQIASAGGGIAKNASGQFTLTQLAAFVSTANVFVSNSTGPLHIAAAVGTPVVAFYPPATVMSERRWGPLTEKKIVFVPDPALCPRCKGGACLGNECMNQVSSAQVLEAVSVLSKKFNP
jgi:heptosyltransferase-2